MSIELIKTIVYYLAAFTLIFAASEFYLKATKLWEHKHANDVAESISISGELVSVGPMIIWAINYFFINYWIGVVDEIFLIALSLLRILVAVKLWVIIPENQNSSQPEILPENSNQELIEEKTIKNTPYSDSYYVIIIPQNEKQEQAIVSLLPELSQSLIKETKLYHSHIFNSKEDAYLVSKSYRELNFYSIVTANL